MSFHITAKVSSGVPRSEASKAESLLSEAQSEPDAAAQSQLVGMLLLSGSLPYHAFKQAGYEFQSNGVIDMLEKLNDQFKQDSTGHSSLKLELVPLPVPW